MSSLGLMHEGNFAISGTDGLLSCFFLVFDGIEETCGLKQWNFLFYLCFFGLNPYVARNLELSSKEGVYVQNFACLVCFWVSICSRSWNSFTFLVVNGRMCFGAANRG